MWPGQKSGIRTPRNPLTLALVFILATQVGHAMQGSGTVQQQIRDAIARDLGLDTTDSSSWDLHLLSSYSAVPAQAHLRVISVRRAPSHGTWLLRLGCDSTNNCLPFYAVLHSLERDARNLSVASAGEHESPPALHSPADKNEGMVPSARSGERVELVEELSGMRLSARAVCLQSGKLGERIRVRNLATNRVLLAVVAGRNQVRVEQ